MNFKIVLLILFSAMILTFHFDKLMLSTQTIASELQPQPDYNLPSTASDVVVSATTKRRQQEAQDLTSAVQKAITRLQNPANCSQAKKLLCHMTWYGCGFGCLIHRTTYCLITALATGRVLVLSDSKWPRSDLVVKTFLRPLSCTCLNYTGPTKEVWEVDPTDPSQTLEISQGKNPNTNQKNKQPYNPPALHSGLADRIFSLAAEPKAWWAGQFVGYLLRYDETVNKRLGLKEDTIDFSSPVVGVHVRRTDKIGVKKGATVVRAFRPEDYMEKVEEWFRKYEMSHNKTKRQIYLATDDAKIIQKFRTKYPEYTIFENIKVAQSAAKKLRPSEESLLGIIHDIHMLSLTNFVVCTHSSNICRVVYELLHFKHGEASTMLHSLDWPYDTFPYVFTTEFQALVDEPSTNLIRGDRLNGVNDFSQEGNTYLVRTVNMRTGEKHSYPKDKIKQIPQLFNFSNFD